MKSEKAPVGYNATQIALHWVIAALVLSWFSVTGLSRYRAFMRGVEPASAPQFDANLHVYVGLGHPGFGHA